MKKWGSVHWCVGTPPSFFVCVGVGRRFPTLPHSSGCSTIGVGGLSFRVRNGSGRFPAAVDHRHRIRVLTWVDVFGVLWCVRYWISGRGTHTHTHTWFVWCWLLWCLFGGLVPVACTHCCACSSGLSTPSSLGHLVLKPHLKTGFPLRCFQRLSLPYVANQHCSWRNNWHTRGTSVPVLSY